MSNIRIFIDFGSTFTKVVAFDLDGEELVSRVQIPSTVDSDITIGLEEAIVKGLVPSVPYSGTGFKRCGIVGKEVLSLVVVKPLNRLLSRV
ncbi:hypothetical protein JCM17380_14660 [Desulfosporosinus burensis]